MDCELSGEKKNAKEGDARWKDRTEKMVGRVRNNIFAKENCSTAEQIKWMSQRPMIEDVQLLLTEAPSQDHLSSEEKTLTSVLQDVVTKFRELSSGIEDTIKSDNVWKTRSLWGNLLDIGVSLPFYLSRLGGSEAEKGAT